MPTPIDILLDPLSLTVLGIYAAFMLYERLRPARPLPRVRGWFLRAMLGFAAFFMFSSYAPLVWDRYLAPYQLVDLSHHGSATGTLVGLLVYELLAYGYHRLVHRFTPLWRAMHQMHHSAERLDTAGAFWFGPLDILGWSLVGSLALVLGVGVSPQAATNVLLLTFALAVFQHANIRTPRWLGYLVQRPESHAVHHARGIHAYNYADLPIFDLLFGSFRNPVGYEHETGFYHGASGRVLDMLLGRDVSEPPEQAGGADADQERADTRVMAVVRS